LNTSGSAFARMPRPGLPTTSPIIKMFIQTG
jgi:hypothetical protein